MGDIAELYDYDVDAESFNNTNQQMITLQEIATRLHDKETITDPFQGIPMNIRQGQSKNGPYWYGDLQETGGTYTIEITAWQNDIATFQGQLVEFSGEGMKRDSYEGKPKISINKKTFVGQPVGGPAPPQGGYTPSEPTKTPSRPSHGPSTPLVRNGQAVGAAFNQANEWLRACAMNGEVPEEFNSLKDYVFSRTFLEDVSYLAEKLYLVNEYTATPKPKKKGNGGKHSSPAMKEPEPQIEDKANNLPATHGVDDSDSDEVPF